MLHPIEPVPDEIEQTLRTILRTKQIPEIEVPEDEIKEAIAIQEGLLAEEIEAMKSQEEDEDKWKALLAKWKNIYEEHEKVCTKASTLVDDLLAKENMEGFKRFPEPVPNDETTGKPTKDALQPTDNSRPGLLTLEDVLGFMSSGMRNGKIPVVSKLQ